MTSDGAVTSSDKTTVKAPTGCNLLCDQVTSHYYNNYPFFTCSMTAFLGSAVTTPHTISLCLCGAARGYERQLLKIVIRNKAQIKKLNFTQAIKETVFGREDSNRTHSTAIIAHRFSSRGHRTYWHDKGVHLIYSDVLNLVHGAKLNSYIRGGTRRSRTVYTGNILRS